MSDGAMTAGDRMQMYVESASRLLARFNMDVPRSPDVHKTAEELTRAMRRAAQAALKMPIETVYPSDWSKPVGAFAPLMLSSLADDDAGTETVFGDEFGITVVVSVDDDRFLLVPIALGIDEDAAVRIAPLVHASIADYVDLDLLSEIIPEEQFTMAAVPMSRRTQREMAPNAMLPLSEAVFLRRPGAWDLLRGSMSGQLGTLPASFDRAEFNMRVMRSMRFDRRVVETNRAMLEALIEPRQMSTLSVEFHNWFVAMRDALDLVGHPQPFDGLSVIIGAIVDEPTVDNADQDRDEDWAPVAPQMVAVGFGLDPSAAFLLYELVSKQPDFFLDFAEHPLRRLRPMQVLVVPDMMLSFYRASLYGMREDALAEIAAHRSAA